ncbi:unnamed protein product [Blepharisma stoltei]|uniref:Crossover junction endonuclease MUS81 n=1 Tax=Blepharisma stoltei TaxID=1481888 RepID=A0AAU9K1X6_9CILI|nr:unnamed protein product [Blepharisma stoltei]
MEQVVEQAKELIVKKVKFLKDIQSLLKTLKETTKTVSNIKSKCPYNQFLLDGFAGLRQDAVRKQNKNMAFCYKKAIKALQRYPLPILHPNQCLQLQGIGNSLLKSVYTIFKSNHKYFKYLKEKEEKKKPTKEPEKIPEKPDIDTFGRILSILDQTILLKDLENIQYEIVLLVDNRENRVVSFLPFLDQFGIKHEERKLGLGDFLWIVKLIYRDKSKKVHIEEYVLDYIIERKTATDLTSSQISNHLRDQIRRMKAESFLNIFLLIEGKADREIILESSLQHNIKVLQTSTQEETAEMMAFFTREISLNASQLSVENIRGKKAFERFNGKHINSKPYVSDIFQTQMADFPGMNVKKVTLLLSLYPTFAAFLDGLKNKRWITEQNLKWAGIGAKVINDLLSFLGIE